jgi:thiamine transport system substrate-binding protein
MKTENEVGEPMTMKIVGLSLMLMLSSVAFAGCIGTEVSVNENDQPNGEPTTLRILSYDAFGISNEMLDEFTNQTGIEVSLSRAGDAGGVLATALQTQNAPIHDLILGIDNSYLGAALEAGLFQPIELQTGSLAARAAAPYVGNLVVPFDYGSVCINYDSTYVDGENMTVPESLWDFTGENWTGKVAVQNPRTSSPGRSFLIATTDYFANDADGDTDYADWWAAMNANEVIVTDGWTAAYETHYTGGYGQWYDGFLGDAHAVVSYCHSPGVEAFFGSNWTTSVALDIPGASFAQVEYAGIPVGAGETAAATTFIEWLLSPNINSQMPTLNYMYSALDGTDLPETDGYRHHSATPTDAEVSPAEISANITDWLNEWDTAMA